MKNFSWVLMVLNLLLGVAAVKQKSTKVCFTSPSTGQLVCIYK